MLVGAVVTLYLLFVIAGKPVERVAHLQFIDGLGIHLLVGYATAQNDHFIPESYNGTQALYDGITFEKDKTFPQDE